MAHGSDFCGAGGLVAFSDIYGPTTRIWLMASNGANVELISPDGDRPIFSP